MNTTSTESVKAANDAFRKKITGFFFESGLSTATHRALITTFSFSALAAGIIVFVRLVNSFVDSGPFADNLLNTKGVYDPFSKKLEPLCFFYCSALLKNLSASFQTFMSCNTQFQPNPLNSTHPVINVFQYFQLVLYLCGAPGQIDDVSSASGGSSCNNNSLWSLTLNKALYGLEDRKTNTTAVADGDTLRYGLNTLSTWLQCSDPPDYSFFVYLVPFIIASFTYLLVMAGYPLCVLAYRRFANLHEQNNSEQPLLSSAAAMA